MLGRVVWTRRRGSRRKFVNDGYVPLAVPLRRADGFAQEECEEKELVDLSLLPLSFSGVGGVHRRASSCGDGGHSKAASKLNTTSERGGYRDDPTHQPTYPNGA
jgi:hypothetical protein